MPAPLISFGILCAAALLSPVYASAGAGTGSGGSPGIFVLQLGVLIIAARAGGRLFEKLRLPTVLGELLSGVIIGPYVLGSIGFPGFAHGLFPLQHGTTLPVSSELYAIASVASVILLFMSGLETDIAMFLRYSFAGAMVGLGGAIGSFAVGDVLGMIFLDTHFGDPRCLYLGIISTATSVGITARILSERRKIDSPEGVTILAGAVIDDVLGIIGLGVVSSLTVIIREGNAEGMSWTRIEVITLKALGLWLGATALGFVFARQIASFLKLFKEWISLTIVGLGLAFVLAGVFEEAGLSMIIGSYVVGLTLSKTDLAFVIQEQMHGVYAFFVPLFFAVMGMLVNPQQLVSPPILIFGLVYTLLALASKLLGCGIPALFMKFNLLGATRIGLGMVPRGEVALIIAGIGLSEGLIGPQLFGASILMTVLTTFLAPVLLDISLQRGGRGTRKENARANTVTTSFGFDSAESTEFVSSKLVDYLRDEGFYVHLIEAGERIVQVRKRAVFFSATMREKEIVFETAPEDVSLVKTIMYEALLSLQRTIEKLSKMTETQDMRRELLGTSRIARDKGGLTRFLNSSTIIPELKATTKQEALEELVDILWKKGKITDRAGVLRAVMAREKAMSTGMEHGIALPHAKTEGVKDMAIAVGISKRGIDFEALDEQPCRIIVLMITHTSHPHIEVLATVAARLNDEGRRRVLLSLNDRRQIYRFFASA